jgi:hypothetical protein
MRNKEQGVNNNIVEEWIQLYEMPRSQSKEKKVIL